jgi:hypothetical protein
VLGTVGEVAFCPAGVARYGASIPRRSGPANRSPEHQVRLLKRGAAFEMFLLLHVCIMCVGDTSRGGR